MKNLRNSSADSERREQLTSHCFKQWLSMTPDERETKITTDGLLSFVDDALKELNIPIDGYSNSAIDDVLWKFEHLIDRVIDFSNMLNEFGYEIKINRIQ